MKIYERGSSKRVLGLLATLLILVAVYVSVSTRPQPVFIPAQADPQTLYHTAWEVVGQNFYDQQKLDDWKSWEHKYDGQLSTEEDAEKAVNEMLKSLDDPFTFLLGAKSAAAEASQRQGSFVGIGITLAPKLNGKGEPELDASGKVLVASGDDGYPLINDVIPGGPAAKAGLKGGDRIITVFEEKDSVLSPVDTEVMSIETLSSKLRGPRGSTVMLTVGRQGQTFNVALVRSAVQVPTVTYKMLDGNLGYIRIVHFGADNMVPQLVEAVRALCQAPLPARGLIVDLRGNPGGQVNNAIMGAAVFLERGHVTSQKTRSEGKLSESEISITPDKLVVVGMQGTKSQLFTYPRQVRQQTKLPVVILVNEHSASASEMFSGALQDNGRAVVVGVKTWGKGIGQSLIPMPNGTILHITAFRYYTPKMRWVGDATGGLFSNGIIPDVVVPADSKVDGDNQLKAAQERLEVLISTGR
jgi:carboxyl-terminal processing protease